MNEYQEGQAPEKDLNSTEFDNLYKDANGDGVGESGEVIKKYLTNLEGNGFKICDGLKMVNGEIYLQDGTNMESIVKDASFVPALDVTAARFSELAQAYKSAKIKLGLISKMEQEYAAWLAIPEETRPTDEWATNNGWTRPYYATLFSSDIAYWQSNADSTFNASPTEAEMLSALGVDASALAAAHPSAGLTLEFTLEAEGTFWKNYGPVAVQVAVHTDSTPMHKLMFKEEALAGTDVVYNEWRANLVSLVNRLEKLLKISLSFSLSSLGDNWDNAWPSGSETVVERVEEVGGYPLLKPGSLLSLSVWLQSEPTNWYDGTIMGEHGIHISSHIKSSSGAEWFLKLERAHNSGVTYKKVNPVNDMLNTLDADGKVESIPEVVREIQELGLIIQEASSDQSYFKGEALDLLSESFSDMLETYAEAAEALENEFYSAIDLRDAAIMAASDDAINDLTANFSADRDLDRGALVMSFSNVSGANQLQFDFPLGTLSEINQREVNYGIVALEEQIKAITELRDEAHKIHSKITVKTNAIAAIEADDSIDSNDAAIQIAELDADIQALIAEYLSLTGVSYSPENHDAFVAPLDSDREALEAQQAQAEIQEASEIAANGALGLAVTNSSRGIVDNHIIKAQVIADNDTKIVGEILWHQAEILDVSGVVTLRVTVMADACEGVDYSKSILVTHVYVGALHRDHAGPDFTPVHELQPASVVPTIDDANESVIDDDQTKGMRLRRSDNIVEGCMDPSHALFDVTANVSTECPAVPFFNLSGSNLLITFGANSGDGIPTTRAFEVQGSGTLYIKASDSFSDGWGSGGFVTLTKVNGSSYEIAGPSYGQLSFCEDIQVDDGDIFLVSNVGGDAWQSEKSIEISGSASLCSESSGGGESGGGESGGGGSSGGGSSIGGCMDPSAENYDDNATYSDGSCVYPEAEAGDPLLVVEGVGVSGEYVTFTPSHMEQLDTLPGGIQEGIQPGMSGILVYIASPADDPVEYPIEFTGYINAVGAAPSNGNVLFEVVGGGSLPSAAYEWMLVILGEAEEELA